MALAFENGDVQDKQAGMLLGGLAGLGSVSSMGKTLARDTLEHYAETSDEDLEAAFPTDTRLVNLVERRPDLDLDELEAHAQKAIRRAQDNMLEDEEEDSDKSAALLDPTLPVAPRMTGPSAIQHALDNLDVEKLQKENTAIIKAKKVSKRPAAVDILNTIEGLKRNQLTPRDLMIESVPVLPAVYRPFSAAGTTFIAGDANELYGDIFKYKTAYEQTHAMLGEEAANDVKPLLYNSVKAAFGFGDAVSPKLNARGVKGHFDEIIGSGPKWSFLQRKLISKPQDSVGRAVISIDPDLKMDEIGIPENQAWIDYAPYIQARLVRSGIKPADALQSVLDRTDHATRALKQEMEVRPIMVARAPAWHKFNYVGARPKMVKGNTIYVNPYITTGANADMDGDTMTFHVASHPDTVKEVYEKLMPSKMLMHIKKPDAVMAQLKHEQILGSAAAFYRPSKKVWNFPDEQSALIAIGKGDVSLSDEIEIGDSP